MCYKDIHSFAKGNLSNSDIAKACRTQCVNVQDRLKYLHVYIV